MPSTYSECISGAVDMRNGKNEEIIGDTKYTLHCTVMLINYQNLHTHKTQVLIIFCKYEISSILSGILSKTSNFHLRIVNN